MSEDGGLLVVLQPLSLNSAGSARQEEVAHGPNWRGTVGQVRLRLAGRGADWQGIAGVAVLGWARDVRHGLAPQAAQHCARNGTVKQGRRGSVTFRMAWHG